MILFSSVLRLHHYSTTKQQGLLIFMSK